MATLTIYSPAPLTATSDPRVKEGLLLPFGEFGFTNLGKIIASRGALTVADELDPLTLEHVDSLDAADFVNVEERAEGLWCSIRYLNTPMGDAALAEFESGKRSSLSVEVDKPVIRGGKLIAGVVTGGSQVATPAFPSAKLAASQIKNVPDMGDSPKTTKKEKAMPTKKLVAEKTDAVTEVADALPAVIINGDSLENVTAVSVTDAEIDITTAEPEATEPVTASVAKIKNTALVAANAKKSPDKNKLFAALAKGFNEGLSGRRMEAALSDVIPGNILGIEQPQYVGELWSGVPYERKYIPLFEHADLNSYNIKGWQWKTKPAVDLYGGDKAAIPSGAIETEEVSGVLQRIAGGHDIDRKFRDFSDTDFWAAYFAAMAESYSKVSDRYIRDKVKAIPTVANGGRQHVLNAAMPSGVPKALALITKGALRLLNSDLEVMPTFAMVTASYFEELMYTDRQSVLEYLSASLSLTGGEVSGFQLVPVPDGSLTVGTWVGQVLVGHSKSVKVYELPGSPIRVEAEAISLGGIDEALFGYVGHMVENAGGLISYDAPTAS